MTRETKIGLLVGLAFIIVFAIILSEKGPSSRNTSLPSFTMVDRMGAETSAASSGQPLSNAGRLPVDNALPPIVQPAIGVNPDMPLREEEVAQGPRVGEEELPPLPDSVINLINGKGGETTSDSVGVGEPPVVALPEMQTAFGDHQAAPWTSAEPESHSSVELASSNQPVLSTPTTETPPQTFKIRTEHTVDKGESLGKIAAKYYERSTPQRIDALYMANKDVLDNRHTVKVGQKLKIPDLGEAAKHFEPAPDFALSNLHSPNEVKTASRGSEPVRIPIPMGEKNQSTANTAPTSNDIRLTLAKEAVTPPVEKKESHRTFKVYEVRPSDTLSKIARRELGSEKYTREIYQLNKDVITNKNTIKPGMKLRLPVPSASTFEDQRILTSNGIGDSEP